MNNSVKYAKGKYFNDNLTANKKDPRKTWYLINELNFRQPKKKVIADIETGDKALLLKWLRPLTVISQIVDMHDW